MVPDVWQSSLHVFENKVVYNPFKFDEVDIKWLV